MKRLLILITLSAFAFNNNIYAQFSANFETNTSYYTKKSEQTLGKSEKDYGTNNYLVMSYTLSDFKAGVQIEAYKPVLRGYAKDLDGYMLAMKYLTFEKNGFSVTGGDFFEQFGSGLMFRSWEDRELGINNSIEGGRIAYTCQAITMKGFIGRPRLYMHHESVRITGGDVNLSLSNLMKWQTGSLQLEGAYINKHESLNDTYKTFLSSSSTNLYSAGINTECHGLYTKFEYVYKDKDLHYNRTTADYEEKSGNSELLETGYNAKDIGVALSLRRLERMNTKLTRMKDGAENVFNYLPALTRQYTYSIANLNPYITQSDGEKGGQFDLFFKLKSGWKIHANVASYYRLKNTEFMFLDCNADVEKKWNSSWKTIFLYSFQNNKIENRSSSHIFLADILYKFTPKNALRTEWGYLHSEGYQKDWISALAELTFSPSWSIYVSDLYNSGVTDKHYYSMGVGYSKSIVRIDMSFGHNRAGYVCSGGVCRYSPEYTGFNLTANITL